MKPLLLITFLFFHSISYSQSLTADFATTEKLPDWVSSDIVESLTGQAYRIDINMNPFYLEADFNNEGMIDIAIFVRNSQTGESGIIIKHREDKSTHILAAGQTFNKMTDLDWMDFWKLYREPYADKTTFTDDLDIDGSERIEINYIAIQVGQSEGSSNLIIWDGKQYSWIHTGE
jgi:hypothetical protein